VHPTYSLYFTVGFSPEFIVPRLLSFKSKDIDQVWLVRIRTGRSEDRKSEYAALLVKQALSLSIKVGEIVLDSLDVTSMLCTLSEHMLDRVMQGQGLLVNVSGGPRILSIVTLLSAVIVKALSGSSYVDIEIVPEYAVDKGYTIDLTSLTEAFVHGLEYIIRKIRQTRLKDILLAASEDGKITTRYLADILNIKESTVSNYLYELVQYDLVKSIQKGIYELTPIGKVLSKLLKKLHS